MVDTAVVLSQAVNYLVGVMVDEINCSRKSLGFQGDINVLGKQMTCGS